MSPDETMKKQTSPLVQDTEGGIQHMTTLAGSNHMQFSGSPNGLRVRNATTPQTTTNKEIGKIGLMSEG